LIGFVPGSPLSLGVTDPHLTGGVSLGPTSEPAEWYLNPSYDLDRSMNMTNDWQTTLQRNA